MSLRLVVFDVDGTLVDSQAQILASMAGAFAAVGRPAPPREEVLAIVGLSLPVAIRHLVPGADEAEADAIVAAYKATFQRQRLAGEIAAPLYPGTRAMLDALASEEALLLGVATGKSRRGLDHLVAAHDLAGYFVTRQVADDHPSKPHPSMLQATLRETGAEAASAVMVGDTEFDIEMGRAAGFFTIGVSWGYHGPARLSRAHRVIAGWDELRPALDGFWEAA